MGGIIGFVYLSICVSLLCRKMGFPAIVGVLTVIPVVGWVLLVGLLWYMAFARWPRWEQVSR